MSTPQEPQRSFFAQKAHRFLAALGFREFRFMALATLCSSSGAWALIVERGARVYVLQIAQATILAILVMTEVSNP